MLGKIAQQLAEEMQSFSAQANTAGNQQVIKQLLQRALRSMDLVTREEFDAQTAVLLRTREKVETLTNQIVALEQGINADSSIGSNASDNSQATL